MRNKKKILKAISFLYVFVCVSCMEGCIPKEENLVIEYSQTENTEVGGQQGDMTRSGATQSDKSLGGTEQSDEGLTGSDLQKGDLPRDDENLIYVYVCGAVKESGVFALPKGSRAIDALNASGGFTEDAQTTYVNLASYVSDGEKLYFPTVDEVENADTSLKDDGMVNINTADKTMLMTLPGIGESKAADIISYRESNGDFQTIEDIMNVPGIKESSFVRLKSLIKVN